MTRSHQSNPIHAAALPRILVIDDILGRPADSVGRERFCEALHLRDSAIKGAEQAIGVQEFLAEVTFESGQTIDEEGWISNEPQRVVKAIEGGWPFQDGSRWALVCIDLEFLVGDSNSPTSELFGADLLKVIEENEQWAQASLNASGRASSQIPLVMLSSYEPDEVERKVRRETNVAFIKKWTVGDDAEQARFEFGRVLFKESLAADGTLRSVTRDGSAHLIGRDSPILGWSFGILNSLREARATLLRGRDARVLIMADRGAGKELFAEYFHAHRPAAKEYLSASAADADGQLVHLNLQEVAEGLRTNALTGHQRGTFTGADQTIRSPFERAGSGTLHLDEIGNLGVGDLQMLLRLVENPTFEVYGSRGTVQIRCQIIMTTNKDIVAKVRDGTFPVDLYDRLDKIVLPPLRSRGRDIAALFAVFVEESFVRMGCSRRKRIQPQAISRIEEHEWSGNVRELQRVAELVVSDREYAGTISARDIDRAISRTGAELQRHWSGRFDELLEMVKAYQFTPYELSSAWPKLEAAIGVMVTNMLETAIKNAKGKRGRRRVECVDPILRPLGGKEKIESGDCKRWIKRVRDDFGASGPAISELFAEKDDGRSSVTDKGDRDVGDA